jgi:HSP20 family molecular chaperone IbpA
MQNNTSEDFQTVKSKRGPGPRGQKVKDRQQKAQEQNSQNVQTTGESKPRLTFKEILFELNNLKRHQHSPKVDLKESNLNYYVRFELPGLNRDDMKIYVRDSQFLLVSATKLENKLETLHSSIYTECNYGYVTRRVKVSSRISNKFDVFMENGVLYITLYKLEPTLDSRLDELSVLEDVVEPAVQAVELSVIEEPVELSVIEEVEEPVELSVIEDVEEQNVIDFSKLDTIGSWGDDF